MIVKNSTLEALITAQKETDDRKTFFPFKIGEVSEWDSEALTFNMGGVDYDMTSYALKQLLKKLKIPAPYFMQCSPDLRTKELREALQDANKKTEYIFKVINEEGSERPKIFGIVPPQYYSALTSNFLSRVNENMPKDMEVSEYNTNLEYTRVRLLPKDKAFIEVDEIVPGVDLWYSEVGAKPFLLQSVMFRKVCSNGMMLPEAGAPSSKIPLTRFKEEQFQAILSSLREDLLDQQLPYAETMEKLKTIELPQEVKEDEPAELLTAAKNLIMPSRLLQRDYGDTVTTQYIKDGNFTMNGMLNAVTRIARDIDGPDKLALESTAGAFTSRVTSLERDHKAHNQEFEYSIPNFTRLFKRHV